MWREEACTRRVARGGVREKLGEHHTAHLVLGHWVCSSLQQRLNDVNPAHDGSVMKWRGLPCIAGVDRCPRTDQLTGGRAVTEKARCVERQGALE